MKKFLASVLAVLFVSSLVFAQEISDPIDVTGITAPSDGSVSVDIRTDFDLNTYETPTAIVGSSYPVLNVQGKIKDSLGKAVSGSVRGEVYTASTGGTPLLTQTDELNADSVFDLTFSKTQVNRVYACVAGYPCPSPTPVAPPLLRINTAYYLRLVYVDSTGEKELLKERKRFYYSQAVGGSAWLNNVYADNVLTKGVVSAKDVYAGESADFSQAYSVRLPVNTLFSAFPPNYFVIGGALTGYQQDYFYEQKIQTFTHLLFGKYSLPTFYSLYARFLSPTVAFGSSNYGGEKRPSNLLVYGSIVLEGTSPISSSGNDVIVDDNLVVNKNIFSKLTGKCVLVDAQLSSGNCVLPFVPRGLKVNGIQLCVQEAC
ncbi:MAG TPA: hypothetical protein VJI71_00845 [Candidatus Norongarragalinales archaeon]|nr:hypothetical protein [Candidatus Norongarragalinales archaeon]